METHFSEQAMSFDFDGHRKTAAAAYAQKIRLYEDFATEVHELLEKAFDSANIRVHSIESRAKEPESFEKKASTPSDIDPTKPKYENPIEQISDLAGVRVITFTRGAVEKVCDAISKQFEIVEQIDHGASLLQQEKFGYQSVHVIARLNHQRLSLPEYSRFQGLKVEIQVRTILQHAWAEIEHDIGYKSSEVIPTSVRRRFAALAGMLEIADREFEAVQAEDSSVRTEALASVDGGRLDSVEVTPYSLKTYLDKRLGSDARVRDYSYDYLARWVRKLGFMNLGQIDKCIDGLNDDSISRVLSGYRQGQITRFEYMIRIGMGESLAKFYAERGNEYYAKYLREILEKARAKGIRVGSYSPS